MVGNNLDRNLVAFGKKVKYYRTKEKKLSLRGLAKRCDVEHSKIAKIEKGQVKIQLPTVFELAKGLEIHPKELFNFEVNLD
ncbi:XRE family transcriptional regulator [Christiangramia fulva]|uniref:XRE family transcriptional regulator n=1 Tax=Christiangramia fulva TaxID=2126553 RepID=A0A2R3Z1U3_9FLAO|nr:helix-turn-helix transcriptional regulator [Christiangramia fulva]AVR44241.1 XRE family transcriptional regulator [Christiangramia fulva]